MQRIALLVGMLALSTALAGCIVGDAEPADAPEPPDATTAASVKASPVFGIINGVPCGHEPRSTTVFAWEHPGHAIASGMASFELPPFVPLVDVRLQAPLLVAGSYDIKIDGPQGTVFAEQATRVGADGIQATVVAELGDWAPDRRAPGSYTMTWETTGAMVGFGLQVVAQVCG